MIWGEKGVIELEAPFWKSRNLQLALLGNPSHTTIATPYLGNGYIHEIESFLQCVMTGGLDNPIHNHGATLRVLRILEQNSPLYTHKRLPN